MNNTLLRWQFLYKLALMILYAWLKGIRFVISDYMRTAEEQNKKFKDGRSNCDGYKNISMHQKARAVDIVIITKDGQPIWKHTKDYDILGKFWQGLGDKCIWGGTWYQEGKTDFDDIFHFQR